MLRRSRYSRRFTGGTAAAVAAVLILPMTASGTYDNPELRSGATDVVDLANSVSASDEEPDEIDWDDYEKLTVSEDTGEPIGMAVLPDSRVLHTARDGVVRVSDQETGLTDVAAEIDVYSNSEDGLQGIALDPDFEENNWVYMAYAPREMSGTSPNGVEYPETTPSGQAPEELPEGEDPETYWDQWLGYNVLSRFQWDDEADEIDLDSEEEIIKVEAQRGQCCHVGADIAFDNDGNLFLSTGDNTPADAPGADGFTPINNAPDVNPGFDSRRGAGNTNDLRGAILRIDVNDDIEPDAEPGEGETYTIPEGNFFDSEEYADQPVRDEIYVFGLRNPFRMHYDPESESLSWGDYGPDAPTEQEDRGPMGYVEWQLTNEPINGGWPYCHGPNDEPYNEWDFENDASGDQFFDCDEGPENNSTWNTGMDDTPPATEPQIWYGNDPGDQPEDWDGLVTFTETEGQAPMGGPIFRYDEDNDSPTQFPEFWDGAAFMGEFSQDYIAAFEMDELTTDGTVTDIHNFLPNDNLWDQMAPGWSGIMDMEFGPDGSLYTLEYGKGFFQENPEAGVFRVDYNPDDRTPHAAINADSTESSEAPLEVTFDASNSHDPEGEELTYEWDFTGNGEIDDEGESVTYTYEELGQYDVVLSATDPEGNTDRTIEEITVGNTPPEITLDMDDGAIFDWGDSFATEVEVSDAEDGNDVSCEDTNFIFGLGHDEHAHPLNSDSANDECQIEVQTRESAREHGEGEKIYGSLVVDYTDQGGEEGVPPVTEETTLTLKPEVQEAEWYDDADDVTTASDDDASAGNYVTDFDEGDSITFSPMAFTHAPSGDEIDTVTARGRGEGTVSLAWSDEESDENTTFAEFEFTDEDDWEEIDTTLEQIPEGSGSVIVTTTGGVDFDSLHFQVSDEEIPVDQVSIGMFSLIPWVEDAGLESVLERIASIGLVNIEPFGGNLEDMTAEELRDLADELNLTIPTSHLDVSDADAFDQTLEDAEALGQESWVGSGGFADPGIESYEDTLATAETMNELGQRSVEAGTGQLFGHNHDEEFTTTYEHEGEELSAWEILVEETDPEYVTFQLDIAWAAHAGIDVPELIEDHGDRIDLLHVKDGTDIGDEEEGPNFTNLGEGEMPLQEILRAGQEADVQLYTLEYDEAPDGEDFTATGFEYLTGETVEDYEGPSESEERQSDTRTNVGLYIGLAALLLLLIIGTAVLIIRRRKNATSTR